MKRAFPSPLAGLRLLLLSLAASLGGTVQRAEAAIIHIDLAASPLAIPAGLDGLYVNFVTGASSTAAVPPAGWDFNPYHNGTGLAFFGPDFPNGQGTLVYGSTALSLLAGDLIGGDGIYQPSQALGSNFYLTGTGFAGLRFFNESTGQLNYGWALLSTTAQAGFPAALLGYAYENTGEPIRAGALPEPAASGLAALAGLLLLRRRTSSAAI